MKRASLRLRLLTAAGGTFFLALTLAWLGLTWLFERHVERREAAALIRAAEVLVGGLRVGPDGVPIADALPDDRRFELIASGLYWQLSTPAGTRRSSSLWDQVLGPVRATGDAWETRSVAGPFGGRVLVVGRLVRPDRAGPAVVVQVAENNNDVVLAEREFGRELAISLLGLWIVLSAATWAQVQLGLRPLARIRDQMERLRRNPAARLPDDYPSEISPLSQAINALADARGDDLVRARNRAADLAHSLKTPLAVMAAQTRRARAAGADEAADGLERAVAAIGAALETELARSRAAAARGAAELGHARPLPVVDRLIGVIEHTERGEMIAFEVDVDAALTVPVAADDLAEMLGALIENAARHARRMVRVAGRREPPGRSVLTVEDDGPGIDEASAATALMRGRRLDETGAGHGFGLSIVRNLIDATEGEIRFGRAGLGGLSVSLSWALP
ncbi:MAG: sensor histidine kinase [Proteobacteria bacterium]|nr:sensor histidine kinase [Pseudomonadota bacterium]